VDDEAPAAISAVYDPVGRVACCPGPVANRSPLGIGALSGKPPVAGVS
jgi:hypothetical protein